MATEEVAMAYPPGAVERAMKAHEVIMRALNGQLTWIQAAEILGRQPAEHSAAAMAPPAPRL